MTGADNQERCRRTAEVLWRRQRPAGSRGPKPAFDVSTIARAGIALADAHGLAAVTMQRVAQDLGVTKMALYRYVPDKTTLVALMVDECLNHPPALTSIPGGWRPRLDSWARHLLDLFTRHPWTLEATVGPRPMGPNETRWLEQALAVLTDTGLPGSDMLDVAVTLTGHVRHIAQQTARHASEHATQTTLTQMLSGHETTYPTVTAAIRSARESATQDQALNFGLRCILDGVESRIHTSKRSADHRKPHRANPTEPSIQSSPTNRRQDRNLPEA